MPKRLKIARNEKFTRIKLQAQKKLFEMKCPKQCFQHRYLLFKMFELV